MSYNLLIILYDIFIYYVRCYLNYFGTTCNLTHSHTTQNLLPLCMFRTVHHKLPLYIVLVVQTIGIILSCQNALFWDTIQFASLHPKYFFDTNFTQLLLPPDIDSGHPPLFGMYIALVWKLFGGQSLAATHLAMLPWVWLSSFFCYQVGRKYWGEKKAGWWLLLWSCCPIWATQSLLVSPDIMLVCASWMALSAIISDTTKRQQLAVAIAILCMVSMRGMMVSVAFLIWQIVVVRTQRYKNIVDLGTNNQKQKHGNFQRISSLFDAIKPYILGLSLGFAYLVWHYSATGWVGYHPSSLWSPAFQRVDMAGFCRNVVLLVWRLCDVGMLGIWLVIIWSVARKPTAIRRELWLLLAAMILLLTPSMLLHKGLIAHRYLLPIYAVGALMAADFLFQCARSHLKVAALGIFLLAGNFWVYPAPISNGWDSTLAHLPYYGLRRQMIAWIDAHQIGIAQTGSSFPNRRSLSDTDLNTDPRQFAAKDYQTNRYILYSNIFNDFDTPDFDTLRTWRILHELKSGQVVMRLYAKP